MIDMDTKSKKVILYTKEGYVFEVITVFGKDYDELSDSLDKVLALSDKYETAIEFFTALNKTGVRYEGTRALWEVHLK